MLSIRYYIISILFFLFVLELNASHIIGGEMTMNHIVASRYEVSLRLFYDAQDGQDIVEDSIIISSYRQGDHQKIEDYFMLRNLDYDNVELSNSLCRDGLNIRIYTYKSTVFLDQNLYNSPSGYYFSWQRCCRANGISNILNSGTTGFVFYYEFAATNDFPSNSSPKFESVAGDFYCVGNQIELDFGANDVNNDNLVYSLVTPIAGFTQPDDNVIIGQSGPYPLVNGYYDIPSVNGIQISPEGILSFTPNQAGLFTIAVKCEEFRNGEKIGAVVRDMVILVKNCEENSVPSLTFFPFEENIPYVAGDTIIIKNQDELCHLVQSRDGDFDKPLSEMNFLSINLLGYNVKQPIINAIQDGANAQWQICLPDCESPEDNYFKIRFTVKDDNCPLPAESSLDVNFKILETEDVPPLISTNYFPSNHLLGEEINFQVNVVDPDSSGINITMSGDNFEPTTLEMDFSYKLNDCCEANGEYKWTPDCSNILDRDNYKLYFFARGNNCGIAGEDSLSINLIVENPDGFIPDDISFPNVITANGDGINDQFYFPVLDENLCLENAFEKIVVYNRWGRQVFESKESTFVWDASNVNAGDYFYQIQFDKKSFKGFLRILK